MDTTEHQHPLPPRSPSQAGVERRGLERRGGTPADPRNLTSSRSLPTPSPSQSWAEVVRGGEERRGQPPPHSRRVVNSCSIPAHPSHTPSSSPLPSPSALDQFRAWLQCRKEGFPAKLVLETDGVEEEVHFWYRPTARATTTPTQPSKRMRRRSRERRRRKARAQRRKEAWSREGPQPAPGPTDPAVVGAVPSLSGASPVAGPGSPPVVEPPAKRPKCAAVVSAIRQLKAGNPREERQPSFPPPEQIRGEGDVTAGHNVSLGEVQERAEEPELPDSPLPLLPPVCCIVDCYCKKEGEADYHEEV